MKIVAAGTGYVGLSLTVLLSQHNGTIAVDIIHEKVEKINRRQSPIQDEYIKEYLAEKELKLTATTDGQVTRRDADFVIIATSKNYDSNKKSFVCSVVETAIELVLKVNPNAIMVIKGTIPVGGGNTQSVWKKYGIKNIIFSPEFLGENRELYDNFYPSRIMVGCDEDSRETIELFAELMVEVSEKENTDVLHIGFTEAEGVKFFANTYMTLRVLYFNQLDTYAETKGLDTKAIIKGLCLYPRI